MIEILLFIAIAVAYTILTPRRVGAMLLNGTRIYYPAHMDETLIRNFRPLNEWQRSITTGLLTEGATLDSVSIRDAYMFGPRIGFMLMDVRMYMHGVQIPGAVFLRGTSIAVLMWYRHWTTGEVHVILVRQPRIATGRMMWEVPAGMADASGSLSGQMFKEIQEETGLTPNINDLKYHGAAHTSCGLLDEALGLYSLQISPDSITPSKEIRGNAAENEMITSVAAFPLDIARSTEDGKLHILLSFLKL